MEYPLFLESMIPTTASVFVADISVSERRKGVRHQLCWLWWPVTAKLMIAACLYSFYAFHSTGNTESSSTYRRPTWEPRLLARLRTRPRPRHRVLWSACYVPREQLHTLTGGQMNQKAIQRLSRTLLNEWNSYILYRSLIC